MGIDPLAWSVSLSGAPTRHACHGVTPLELQTNLMRRFCLFLAQVSSRKHSPNPSVNFSPHISGMMATAIVPRQFLLLGLLAILPELSAQSNSDESDGSNVVDQLLALPEDMQEELPDDVKDFLAELDEESDWFPSFTLSALAGERDNVGLSTIVPQSSYFGEARVEGFLWWQPLDSVLEALVMIDGRHRTYENNPVVDDEQSWLGQAEVRWMPLRWFDLKARSQGFYQDEVIDLSTSAAQRTVLPIQVLGGRADLTAKVNLPFGFSVESKAGIQRADYHMVAEDYYSDDWWHGVNWSPRRWITFSYGQQTMDRDYDFRSQTTAGGRSISDTFLAFGQDEERGRLRLRMDWRGRWRLDVSGGVLENRDNAAGFFDYDWKRWWSELEWVSPEDRWEFRVEWEEKTTDYLNQTVGAGLNPEDRNQVDRLWRGEVIWRFNDRWNARVEYEDVLSESNEVNATYRDRTIWFGLSFDS